LLLSWSEGALLLNLVVVKSALMRSINEEN
jgi:hypothetical protein